MATRYFKATDGKITVFRASKTRVYRSARIHGVISFSTGGNPSPGWHPAVEIDQAEYVRLNSIKTKRIAAAAGQRFAGPQDSWVENADLASCEVA